jgi:hypothetical protein
MLLKYKNVNRIKEVFPTDEAVIGIEIAPVVTKKGVSFILVLALEVFDESVE